MGSGTEPGRRIIDRRLTHDVGSLGLLLILLLELRKGIARLPFFADDFFFLEQARGRSLAATLASPDPLGNFLRPVSRQVWFWVMGRMSGESPAIFHIASLAVFLLAIAALYFVVRRRLGSEAGWFASLFVGLHYASDVPLMWAAGSQDLLAVLFATVALLLHLHGRRVLAVAALLLALLSKEAVAGVALVALVADHREREPWRGTLARGWGLIAASGAWAALWFVTRSLRPAAAAVISFSPGNLLAAFVHLPQVALGLESRTGGGPGHWGWSAMAIALAATATRLLIVRLPADGEPAPTAWERRAMRRIGLTWVIAGTLPIALVAGIWSAYFYLWALFGVGVTLAALTAGLPRAARLALLALLVLLSGEARALDEFATGGGAWSWRSHVNARYLERGMDTVARGLRQMRAQRPTLPRRSTVYFADVPVSSGWQAGDGPLVRWAYRDTTLRSYFLTQFTSAQARRGPLFFFAAAGDSLVDRSDDPQLLPSFAYSMLLADRPAPAADALGLVIAAARDPRPFHYWRALAGWAQGDTLAARRDLDAAGMRAARGMPPDVAADMKSTPADTLAWLARLTAARDGAALEPRTHERLALLRLARGELGEGVIEAYAARVLAPGDQAAWRGWGAAQLAAGHDADALRSLEHYLAMAGPRGAADAEARAAVESLRRTVHGDLAGQALRERR